MQYVACTRMYNASPSVTDLWSGLAAAVSRLSGVKLTVIAHSAPKDIEELWARPDLGFTFICGRPFVLGGCRHQAIGVPLRTDAGYAKAPLYHSEFLVRADSPFHSLEDTFGSRLGWTLTHSQSGFAAPMHHLHAFTHAGGKPLYREMIGPLHSPAGCLAALRDGRADVVPLDAYFLRLAQAHCPELLQNTRSVAATAPWPAPFLAASPEVPLRVVEALRNGLMAASEQTDLAETLAGLGISGFAPVTVSVYKALAAMGPFPDPAPPRPVY